MPRISGTYSAPPSSWNPAVSGNAAAFGDWNTLLSDLSSALTQSLSQDGQTNPTANLPMAGFKHTGAGNASGAGQYIVWGQNCTLGTVTVSGMAGDGSGLTALNASSLSTGTIPDARFPATLPSGVAVATAPQFDNDTSIATTAFVQRALGNQAGYASYNTSTTIATADVGKCIIVPSGSPSVSLALPTSLPGGSRLVVYNNTAANTVTLTASNFTSGTYSGGSITISPGQAFDLVVDGSNNWVVAQGDPGRQAKFAASLATSGYQYLPSGLILQWGTTASIGLDSSLAVTFPVAFPTACLSVQTTGRLGSVTGGTAYSIGTGTYTTSGFTIYNDSNAQTVAWFAVGY